jgi:1,5-anhydro-D-fructose reductase (1,5-anhydro-D-mannitol-forming)
MSLMHITMTGVILSELHWGIIGCGDVVERKSGPPLANAASGSFLRAVSRRSPGKAEEFAKKHGVPVHYTTSADLLADPVVNAVYIATAPDTHLELALAAAEAGHPTLLEKPMARSSAEASVIQGVFARRNIPLFVSYYRRALPRYVRAKQLLADLGNIFNVSINVRMAAGNSGIPASTGWRVTKTVSGGGLFVDVGSHVVDIVDWMLGPLLVTNSHTGFGRGADAVCSWGPCVQDTSQFAGAEDHVVFSFSLPCNRSAPCNVAVFDFDSTPEQETDRITVVGEHGVLSFPALGLTGADPEIRLQDSYGGLVLRETVNQPEFVHDPFIASVVGVLRGDEGALCESMADSGLRASLVVDAALEWGRDPATLRLRAFASKQEREEGECEIRKALDSCGRTASL